MNSCTSCGAQRAAGVVASARIVLAIDDIIPALQCFNKWVRADRKSCPTCRQPFPHSMLHNPRINTALVMGECRAHGSPLAARCLSRTTADPCFALALRPQPSAWPGRASRPGQERPATTSASGTPTGPRPPSPRSARRYAQRDWGQWPPAWHLSRGQPPTGHLLSVAAAHGSGERGVREDPRVCSKRLVRAHRRGARPHGQRRVLQRPRVHRPPQLVRTERIETQGRSNAPRGRR